jgi:hypothetical protein
MYGLKTAQKITGIPRLSRVRDARAALPQNCSLKKLKRVMRFWVWHFRAIIPRFSAGHLFP